MKFAALALLGLVSAVRIQKKVLKEGDYAKVAEEVFQTMDNEEGIDRDELEHGLKEIHDDAIHFFEFADKNGNNKVTLSEAEAAIKAIEGGHKLAQKKGAVAEKLHELPTMAEVKHVLGEFDPKDHEFLTKDEAEKILRELHIPEVQVQSDIEGFMEHAVPEGHIHEVNNHELRKWAKAHAAGKHGLRQ